MNKTLQLVQAVGCLYEMELRQKSLKGPIKQINLIKDFYVTLFYSIIIYVFSMKINDLFIFFLQ